MSEAKELPKEKHKKFWHFADFDKTNFESTFKKVWGLKIFNIKYN